MTQYLVPFTVALIAQFRSATAIQTEEDLALAQLKSEWLNDGVEYIYAQSESMAELNEEDDEDYDQGYLDFIVNPEDFDDEDDNVDLPEPEAPFGLNPVELELL